MGIIRAELGERVDDITLTALRMARVGSKWLPVSFFIHSYKGARAQNSAHSRQANRK